MNSNNVINKNFSWFTPAPVQQLLDLKTAKTPEDLETRINSAIETNELVKSNVGVKLNLALFALSCGDFESAKTFVSNFRRTHLLKSWVNRPDIVLSPVILGTDEKGNAIIGSQHLYARTFAMQDMGVLTVHWVAPFERTVNGKEVYLTAPEDISWGGFEWRRVAESYRKAFYVRKGKKAHQGILNRIKDAVAKDVLDLSTIMKRSGKDFLPYVDISKVSIGVDSGEDLGVRYLPDGVLPAGIHAVQGTIVWSDGSTEKGMFSSARYFNMPVGANGTLKRPKNGKEENPVIVSFTVMTIPSVQPWKTNYPMQAAQYKSIDRPAICREADQLLEAMAALGARKRQYNSAIFTDIVGKTLLEKAVAGQVLLGNFGKLEPELIVRGSAVPEELHGVIREVVVERAPVLPSNNVLVKVRAHFERVQGFELEVITNYYHKDFMEFYVKMLGGDWDGDGILLAWERWLLAQAVDFRSVEIKDLNAAKNMEAKDQTFVTHQELVSFATRRMRKYHKLVGRFDLIGRRYKLYCQISGIEPDPVIIDAISVSSQGATSAVKKPVIIANSPIKLLQMIAKQFNPDMKGIDKMRYKDLIEIVPFMSTDGSMLTPLREMKDLVKKANKDGFSKNSVIEIEQNAEIIGTIPGYKHFGDAIKSIIGRLMVSDSADFSHINNVGEDLLWSAHHELGWNDDEVRQSDPDFYEMMSIYNGIMEVWAPEKKQDVFFGGFVDDELADEEELEDFSFELKLGMIRYMKSSMLKYAANRPAVYDAFMGRLMSSKSHYLIGEILTIEDYERYPSLFRGFTVKVAKAPDFKVGDVVNAVAIVALIPNIDLSSLYDDFNLGDKYQILEVQNGYFGDISAGKARSSEAIIRFRPYVAETSSQEVGCGF